MNIKTLQKNLKLNDKMRDFNWVLSQYKKKRLVMSGEVLSAQVFNQFREAIRTVQDIYDNEWDIEYDVGVRQDSKGHRLIYISITSIVLYFSNIVISNRDKDRHTIKDLFVRIPLSKANNSLRIGNLQGTRQTISYAEYCSNYFHSHLSTVTYKVDNLYGEWSTFCTGSGEINIYHSDINSEGFTVARFTKFLVQILTLVSYESIEGTPYRYIKNIMMKPEDSRRFSVSTNAGSNLLSRLYRHYKTNKIKVNFQTEILDNRYKIIDNNNFDDFLTSISFTNEDKLQFLCRRDEAGNYHTYDSSSGYYQPIVSNVEYLFRGEVFKFKVEDIPAREKQEDIKLFIHPTIKENLKKLLEYDINKKIIRKSTIERYSNQTDNA